MKMFDWDDEEIANILWGEGREADDHIVPYPEDIEIQDLSDYGDDNDEEKPNGEDTNIKGAGKIPTTSKLLADGGVQGENDSAFASGTVTGPQLNSSSVGTSKTDSNAVGMETELDIGPEVFGNQQEHKQLGELVDNSWADIASFDDLDRIFSNDDLEGHTSLGSTEDLWSPSKDLIREAGKSSSAILGSRNWELGALVNTSSQNDLNSEYLREEFPPAATRGKAGIFVEQQEYTESTSALAENKVQAMDKLTDSAFSGDVYSTWPSSASNISHYDRLCVPTSAPSFPSAVTAYQHVTNACVPPYRNFPQQYTSTHILKPTSNEHQSIHASSEVCQGDVSSFGKPVENSARPKKMTPQEKIEKLRRRQQMRAMLAIQKQQQQLSQQTSCVEYPLTQKSGQEEQFLQVEKSESEADDGLSNRPYCDPGSPNMKENICTISDMDEISVEDTVLYQLQDIVKRLDTKVRLCIKDSLYRLAHSATQRHYVSDMNTASRTTSSNPEMAKEEMSSHHRNTGNPNVETDTNHIDRAVAHLLFHQPFKMPVKLAETPESSTSKRVCPDKEITDNCLRSSFLASDKSFSILSEGNKTLQPPVDSYLEDMQDISHTQNSVNPRTE